MKLSTKEHCKLVNNLKRIAGVLKLLQDEIDKMYEDLTENGKDKQ